MGTISDALAWSGSAATLSMFVVSSQSSLLDLGALSLGTPPIRTTTFPLDDEDRVLGGRHVAEYDLVFSAVPPDLDSLLTQCLVVARAFGAEVAWFGFEGSFDFRCLLTAEIANQVYALIDSEGVALASDDTLTSTAWQDRVVSAGGRIRGASRSGPTE